MKYSLTLILLMTSCLLGCGKSDKAMSSAEARLSAPIAVTQLAEMPTFYSVSGSVVSDDRIDLSSRVVGFIQRLDVREGQVVTKGDSLVQIDPADINEAIRQSQAGVTAARNDLDDAERDVEKYAKLVADGFVPTETLRKAKVRRDIAQSTLAKAQAALASALAQRNYAEILSPVDGVVVGRYRNVGEMATTGQPILTLESRQHLVLRVFVPEMQMAKIAKGMAIEAKVDALPNQDLPGSIHRIVPSGDPTTRRYQVDVSLLPELSILPGMFGRVEFPLGQAKVLLIPRQALTRRGGLEGVFTVDETNTARFRWLRLGRSWQELVEVVDGLSPGERIVLHVDDALRDGVIVEDAAHG